MASIKLHITGMKCGHCVQTVTDALNAIEGVNATVSLDQAMATAELIKTIETSELINAVEKAGFGAQVIS